MKFKKEIPNKFDYMRSNTIQFLENEKANTELTHEKNIQKIQNYGDRRLHHGKEIQNSLEYMKGYLPGFIQNEKIFSEITHERNIGKLYKLNILLEDNSANFKEPPKPKNHTSVVAVSSTKEYSNLDEKVESRTVEKTSKTQTEEKSETSILTKSRLDQTGSAPKRYTTKCFIKPVPIPVWYTESMTIKLNSTKKTYEEKVYFKVKMNPYKWSETMTTEVQILPKIHFNEVQIPVEKSDVHYISLEPQQIAVV